MLLFCRTSSWQGQNRGKAFLNFVLLASVSCRDDQHGGGAEADGGVCQRAQLHSVERPQLQPGGAVLAAFPHRLPRGDPGVHPGPVHPHRPEARLGQQTRGR